MNGYTRNSRKIQMTKKIMKDIDIEISEDTDKTDFPVEKFMKTLGAIDWKLWEILKILQKFDDEEIEDEKAESDD